MLASSLKNDYVDRQKLAFGIESEVEHTDDRLHFFIDPKIIQQGAAWIFPIGNKSRIGLANELIVGKILALLNRDNKTRNVEIQNEFYKYDPKTPVLRIFVD